MTKRGRPPKLTGKRRKAFLEELRLGKNLHAACVAVGVSYMTLRRLST